MELGKAITARHCSSMSKICGLQERVKIEEWRVEITKKVPFSDRNPQIIRSEATLALPLGELAAP